MTTMILNYTSGSEKWRKGDKYNFDALNVGDDAIMPLDYISINSTIPRIASYACIYNKKNDKKILVSKVRDGIYLRRVK